MVGAELRVWVAYGTRERQCVLEVGVAPGTTIEQAIRASGILERYPQIDLATQAVGIFGERAALSERVRDGDRVEIYRPLVADPKEARRRRASRGRRSR
jgi:putative ubiquitin-RnfH superfamily antitoxin RatB of RatAB toxin-antitoxin module